MKVVTLKDLLAAKEGDLDLSEIRFEDGIKLLEELVQKVESGNLALEQGIVAYEQGVKLIISLRALLSGAEERLRILQKENPE